MTRASVLLLTLALTGCGGARITPPPAPADPVSAYVVDYGRHSSLMLPSPSDGKLHEYAFGDFYWFALNRKSWHNAVAALFLSNTATLGRRTLDAHDDPAKLADAAAAKRVLAFQVSRDRAVRLLDRLEARYRRSNEPPVYNPRSSLYFVRDDERYSFRNNCNHVTARWLESLGCKVRGSRMTSKFTFAR